MLWTLRQTLARSYNGQHQDNKVAVKYLVMEAGDIEWSVYRAGIGSGQPSKGVLERSKIKFGVATHQDCDT